MIGMHFEVVELFAHEYGRELTINQICKELKKPYASVNKYVHELIKQGIIHTRQIGSALLCTLDWKHEMTIGILTLLSIQKTAKKTPSQLPENPHIIALFKEKGKIVAVVHKRIPHNTQGCSHQAHPNPCILPPAKRLRRTLCKIDQGRMPE